MNYQNQKKYKLELKDYRITGGTCLTNFPVVKFELPDIFI